MDHHDEPSYLDAPYLLIVMITLLALFVIYVAVR